MWTRSELAKMIDHTVLRPDATLDDVLRTCDEAEAYHFASVVVLPCWVPSAARRLGRGEVKVGTVIGFPLGANSTRVKVYEAQNAIAGGAQEIEAVINISALKSGAYTQVRRDMEALLNAAHMTGAVQQSQDTLTRFVLESHYLTEQELVAVAELLREMGAEFLVTATGFAPGGADTDLVRLLRRTVGATMGIKAVGGIHGGAQALDLLNSGANRIGTAAGIQILAEAAPTEAEAAGTRRR